MKRHRILITITALLLLGSLAVYFTRPKEPTYKGKLLTVWLGEYQTARDRVNPDMLAIGDCVLAVRAIGTNGIPTLLSLLKAKDFPGTSPLRSILIKQGWASPTYSPAGYKHTLACRGFEILGEDARSATPELLHLLQSDHSHTRVVIPSILTSLKPSKEQALPVLTQLLNSPDAWFSTEVAFAVCDLYPEEAERAGAYRIIPWMRPVTNDLISMDAPWLK